MNNGPLKQDTKIKKMQFLYPVISFPVLQNAFLSCPDGKR